MTFATQTVKHKGNKSISLKSGIEENRRNCGIERRGHKQCKEYGSEKSRSVGRKRMGQSEDDFQQGNWRFHCEIRPAITLSTTMEQRMENEASRDHFRRQQSQDFAGWV